MSVCAVTGCYRKRGSAKGFCNGHYRRWRDKGDPGEPFTPRATFDKRFWARVERRSVLECWAWAGTVDIYGYGVIRKDGSQNKAHRLAYEMLRGAIPAGLTIDHLCWNTVCVNPWHMEPVTFAENARRMNARRTHCKSGHAFTPENTRISDGSRVCVTCARRASADWWRRNHGRPIESAEALATGLGSECRTKALAS